MRANSKSAMGSQLNCSRASSTDLVPSRTSSRSFRSLVSCMGCGWYSESSPRATTHAMRDERDELLEIGRKVIKMARAGAEVAEASIGSSWDLSAKVRLGKPELVEEAGQRGVSLLVLKNGRLAMTSTSDMTDAGLELLVKDALELAELSESDPLMGPAEESLIC